jgi:hypothetical protein
MFPSVVLLVVKIVQNARPPHFSGVLFSELEPQEVSRKQKSNGKIIFILYTPDLILNLISLFVTLVVVG